MLKLVTLVTKVCWHMWDKITQNKCKNLLHSWLRSVDIWRDVKHTTKWEKYIWQNSLYQVEIDFNLEFTIYGGMRGITIRTNVKTCYTLDQVLLTYEEM